jgi:hypothetical protein
VCSMWCNSMYIIHYFALYISFIYGRTFFLLSDYSLARHYHIFVGESPRCFVGDVDGVVLLSVILAGT